MRVDLKGPLREPKLYSDKVTIYWLRHENGFYVYDNQVRFNLAYNKALSHLCRKYLRTAEAKQLKHKTMTAARLHLLGRNATVPFGIVSEVHINELLSGKFEVMPRLDIL